MKEFCPPKHTKAWKHLEALVGEDRAIVLYLANGKEVPDFKKDIGLTSRYYSWQQVAIRRANLKRYNDRFGSSHSLTLPKQVGQADLYTMEGVEDWSKRKAYYNPTKFVYVAKPASRTEPDWAEKLKDITTPVVVKEGSQFISESGNVYNTYEEALEDKQSDDLELPKVEEQDEEVQRKFRQEKSAYDLHPRINSRDSRDIVTTLAGRVLQDINNQVIASEIAKKKNFTPVVLHKSGFLRELVIITKKQRELEAKPVEELTDEEKFSIAQWKLLGQKDVVNKLQTAVLLELKKLGYKVSKGKVEIIPEEQTVTEAEDIDIENAPDDISALDAAVESESDGSIGKSGHGDDYGGMSRSTRETLSTRVKGWLSTIPTDVKSILGFDTFTFMDLGVVISVLNETLLGKTSGEDMIIAMRQAAAKARTWLGHIADRLQQEKALNSPIYHQFVSKFNQKFNQLRLLRVNYKIKGYEVKVGKKTKTVPIKGPKGELQYTLETKVINLNREDIPKNLRDEWENTFIQENYTLTDEGFYELPEDRKEAIQQAYNDFKDFCKKNYKAGGFNNPNEARAQLTSLFKSIGVDLDPQTVEAMINGFEYGDKYIQNFDEYSRTNPISVFRPKYGYLGTIFDAFNQDENPFSSSGMIRVSQINSQYIENYVNTSVGDGKGRKLWAYGLPDPNWVEFNKIISDPISGLSDEDFDKTYVGRIMQDKFSGKSRLLNRMKGLRTQPKELQKLREALQIFTFNTLKTDLGVNAKEIRNMVEAEHIFTKIALFANVQPKVVKNRIIQMFITTPSDKSRMECITTIKHEKGFEIKDGKFIIKDTTVNVLFDYFLSEYERIRQYHDASPEAQAQMKSNENYMPELFYFFPQFNDRNGIWTVDTTSGKFRLVDLSETLANGMVGEDYVKGELRRLAEDEIHKIRSYWEEAGILKDGKLITGIPLEYLTEEVGESYNKSKQINEAYAEMGKTATDVVEASNHLRELSESAEKESTSFLVADYALNYLIHNMEMHLFMLGDPAMYVKDVKGRAKAEKEVEKVYLTDEELKAASPNTLINFVRDVMTNLGKRMAGVQASRQEAADSKGSYTRVLKVADNTFLNGIRGNFISKVYSSPVYTKLLGADTVSKFLDLKSGDGQSVNSAQEDLYLKLKYGKINREQYDTLMNKVRMAEEDIANGKPIRKEAKFTRKEEFFTQPIKPVVFANKLDTIPDGDGTIYKRKVIYYKNSEFALYPQWTVGLEIDQLRQMMAKSKADRILFLSAVKAGADNVIDGIFNQEGAAITISDLADKDHSASVEEVDREYFGIQLEVPYDEEKDKIRIGTQQIKMIFDEVLNTVFTLHGKTMRGRALKALQAKIYGKLVRRKLTTLFQEIGVNVSINGQPVTSLSTENLQHLDFEFANLEKLSKVLLEHAEGQGYSTNVLDGLQLTEDKTAFKLPLIFNGNLQKFEKLLLALVKNIIFQKIHGKSFVLGTELGMLPRKTKTVVKEGEEGQAEIEKYKSSIVFTGNFNWEDGLLPARLEDESKPDGKWLPGQVILPWRFKDSKGRILDISHFTLEETEDGKLLLDLTKMDAELLKIIGIRIPTQGHPSMASIEIVGFLPTWVGDLLIAPQDFVAQFGHDFDVDKLYSYLYNYEHGTEEQHEAISEYRDEIDELWAKENEANAQHKEMIEYVRGGDVLMRDKFTSDVFHAFMEDFVTKRTDEAEAIGIMEYFDTLELDLIKRMNRATKTAEGKRLKDAEEHLGEFIAGEDLDKALIIKAGLTAYNAKVKADMQLNFPKYKEYKEKIKELSGEDATTEERKEKSGKLRELKKQLRLNLVRPDVDNVENNNEEQLQNFLQDIYHSVLSHPEVIKKSLEGIGEGKLKDLAQTIKEFFQQGGNRTYLPFSDKEKVMEYFDNAAGKLGVGIFSIANTFFTIIQEKKVHLVRLVKTKEGMEKVPRPFKVKNADGSTVELAQFSAGKGVNRLISIYQSTSVDNAKYKALYAISENEHTMGVTAVMSALYSPEATEYDEEYITYFLAQPAVQDFVKALKDSQNSLADTTVSRQTAANTYIAVLAKYTTELNKRLKEDIGEDDDAIADAMNQATTNPGYSLDDLKNFFNNQQTNKSDLDFLVAQVGLLIDFYYLKNAADELRSVQYLLNADSKGVPGTLFENDYKEDRFNEVFNDNSLKYFSDNIGDVLNEEDGTDSIPFLMTKVSFIASRLFRGNEKQAPILPFLTHKIGSLYRALLMFTGRNADISFNQKIVKEMFNSYLSYIWTNPAFKISDEESIQIERRNLLFDSDDNVSLATQLEEFRKSPLYFENPRLKPLISSLKVFVDKDLPDLKFVRFNSSAGIVTADDDIRVAFDLLYEKNYPLFERLIKYQLLMQGYQSPTNMRGLIPNYYFTGFNFLPEMQRLNNNLNAGYDEEDMVADLTQFGGVYMIPKFLQQHLQHYPDKAFRVSDSGTRPVKMTVRDAEGRVTGEVADPSQFVVETSSMGEENPHYFWSKEYRDWFVFPYLSKFNAQDRRWQLFRVFESVEGGYLFKEIPTLGVNGVDEFDMAANGDEILESIFPENNKTIRMGVLGYGILAMTEENQEKIRAGEKTMTSRSSGKLGGMWRLRNGLKVQLVRLGQITYNAAQGQIEVYDGEQLVEMLTLDEYAANEGFGTFDNLREAILNGETKSLTDKFLGGAQHPHLYKIIKTTGTGYSQNVQQFLENELRRKISRTDIEEKC